MFSKTPSYLTLLIVCLYTFSAAAVEADKSEIPIEQLMRQSDFLDIKISPDGKHYAARVRDNDTVYMLVMNLKTGKTVGGVRPGKENMIGGMRWVNSERLIYQFAEKSPNFDAPTFTGELFAINFDGKANRLLAGYRADDRRTGTRFSSKRPAWGSHSVISNLVTDDKHVLIVERPWQLHGNRYYDDGTKNPVVTKLNIYSGKKTDKEVIPYPGARVFADDNGNINFVTWEDKKDNLHASYRASKKDKWQDITDVFGEQFSGFTASGVSSNGTKAFLRGKLKSDAAETLYQLDLASKKLTKLFDTEFDLYGWDANANGEPYVGYSFPDDIKYHYVDSPTLQVDVKRHKSLVKAFAGRRLWIGSQTQDSQRFTLRVENSTNPGEFYAYNTDTKKATFLWANYSWIDPRQMLPKQALSFTARDEQTLHGYLTMPATNKSAGKSSDSKQPPLVVLPHGGPHGVRDYPFFDSEVQLLANRGYAVLQVNFRGSGGYTEGFQAAGYRNWGRVMIEDIIDATNELIASEKVDRDRVCVYGASYGGYAAMMSAIKAPELFRCTAGYVGVYDLEAMKFKGDIPKRYAGKGYLRRALGDDKEALRAQSPLHLVDKLKAKVLLIHGDEDIRVPSYHAKALRKALNKTGNKPEWLYLGDVGHGAVSLENRVKVYNKLLGFLDQNLAAK